MIPVSAKSQRPPTDHTPQRILPKNDPPIVKKSFELVPSSLSKKHATESKNVNQKTHHLNCHGCLQHQQLLNNWGAPKVPEIKLKVSPANASRQKYARNRLRLGNLGQVWTKKLRWHAISWCVFPEWWLNPLRRSYSKSIYLDVGGG